ncbi:MAG: hypothetical protein ACK5H2_07405 [Beutenbergiaceae bacterium]
MCGTCARERTTWSSAVLSRAYPRIVVARIATDLVGRKVIGSGPVGWSLTAAAGSRRLCRDLPDLLEAMRVDLDRTIGRIGADGLHARMMWIGRHRRFEIADAATRVPETQVPVPAGMDPDEVLIPRLFYAAAIAESTVAKGM